MKTKQPNQTKSHTLREITVMMSKVVHKGTGGYEKKDKTVILQESTPMHRTPHLLHFYSKAKNKELNYQ